MLASLEQGPRRRLLDDALWRWLGVARWAVGRELAPTVCPTVRRRGSALAKWRSHAMSRQSVSGGDASHLSIAMTSVVPMALKDVPLQAFAHGTRTNDDQDVIRGAAASGSARQID